MEDDTEESIPSVLSGLRDSLTEFTSPSTTPIAQRYARQILDQPDDSKEEADLMGKVSAQAEQTRQRLRDARKRILERRYNPGLAWLAASAALGAPTRTGGIGETFGNVSRALIDPLKEKEALDDEKEADTFKIDQALGGVDQSEIAARLEALKSRRADSAKMKVKALDVLGRRTPGGPGAGGKPGSEFGKLAADSLGAKAYLENGDYSPAYFAEIERLKAADKKRRDATAGVDSGDVDVNDTVAAASELGLPVLTLDPFRGLGTKTKAARQTRLEKEAADKLAAMSDATTGSPQAIQDAEQYIALNKNTSTGGVNRVGDVLGEIPGVGGALKKGVDTLTSLGDDNAQMMDALTNKLTPAMRPVGSGSTSNFEQQMYRGATLNRSNNRAVNENIANSIIALHKRMLEQRAFYQDFKSLYGHLEGADRYWREYIEANPIFDPKLAIKDDGTFRLNPNRQSYKEYFKSKVDQPSEDDPVLEGLTPEERKNALLPAEEPSPIHRAEGGPVEEPEPKADGDEDPGLWKSVMEGLLQGGSGGWSDEMSSNPNAARGEKVIADESHPFAATAGEVSGIGLVLEAAKQALLRSGMAPAALKLVPQAKLLQIGQMILGGGLAGGAWGLGQSEPGQVGDDTANAALRGAVTGPLVGLAAKYGLVGLEKGYDRLRGQSVNGGEKAVLSSLEADQLDPVSVQARWRASNRMAVPTNFGEEAGQALTALQQRVASRTAATRDLTDRANDLQAGQRERVSDRVNSALAPSEYFGEQDKLTSDLYANAKPLYQAAYAKYPALESPALMQILGTPSGKKAAKAALIAMRDRPGAQIGKTDATGMVRKPSLEYLDMVKRELDDMVSKEERVGGFGASKRIRELRNALRNELDVSAPEYKDARAQYAGDLEVKDALRSGREDFARMQPEEVRRAFTNMSFAEKDAFRSGVAQGLFEQINRPSTDANFARRLIGSPAAAEKLGLLFDSPRKAKIFQDALMKEASLYDTRKKVVRKGESNASAQLDAESGMTAIPRRISDVLHTLRGQSDQTTNEAGKILGAKTDTEIADVVANLQPKAERLLARKRRAGKVGLAGALIGGALAARDPAPKHREEVDDGKER